MLQQIHLVTAHQIGAGGGEAIQDVPCAGGIVIPQIVIELNGDGVVLVGDGSGQGSGLVSAADIVGGGQSGQRIVGVKMEVFQCALADKFHLLGQVVFPQERETVALGVLDVGGLRHSVVTHEEHQLVAAALVVEVHTKTVVQAEIGAVLLLGVEVIVVGIAQIGLCQPHAGRDVVDGFGSRGLGLSLRELHLSRNRLFGGGGGGSDRLHNLLHGLGLGGGLLLRCGTAAQSKKGQTKGCGNDRTAFHHAPPLNVKKYTGIS